MKSVQLLTVSSSPPLRFAAQLLAEKGVVTAREPDPRVTHILLPVPVPREHPELQALICRCGPDPVLIGGRLTDPAWVGRRRIDLLQNESYLQENAAITAHCAIREAMTRLPVILAEQPVLVIGWGRIGKHLAHLLRGLGARVTVATRSAAVRRQLRALGFRAVDTRRPGPLAYRVIFNTAPVMVLPEIPDPVLKVDLASEPGLGGRDVIRATGLPGRDAPESSGALIARYVWDALQKEAEK